MDTMDSAALQEVVGAFKEEVKRNRLQEKRLQRENRTLLRCLVRLQQQKQVGREPCNTQDVPPLLVHDGMLHINGEEEECSQEGDDISGSSPSWPSSTTSLGEDRHHPQQQSQSQSPCQRCVADLPMSTSSPRQETALHTQPNGGAEAGVLGDISPTLRDDGNFCELSKEALQVRVRSLEKQLLRERLRRKAQAAEFTAELEILRFALDDAEKRAARPQPWPMDNAAEFGPDPPLLLRPHDGTSDSNLEYHETPSVELATHSRTSTAVSMENAEQATGTEGLEVPRNVALCDMGGCVEDAAGKPRNGLLISGVPACRLSRTDSKNTSVDMYRDCMNSPNDDGAMAAMSKLEPLRDFSTESDRPDTQASEEFLSRAVLRMEGRRQRLRNAVMLRNVLEGNDDGNGKKRDPALDPPKGQMDAHTTAETSPNRVTMPTSSSLRKILLMRELRHLSHRRPTDLSASSFDDAGAGVSRPKSSTPAVANTISNVNPNQLGVGVDPKGPHNRTWYAHQVLRVAFAKVILGSYPPYSSSSSAAAVTAAPVISTRNSFGRISDGCEADTLQERQEHEPQGSLSEAHYLSSDTSSYSVTEEERGFNMEERSFPKADDTLHSQQSPLTSKGLYRNISSAAVRRAIDEMISLRFRCCQNQPLLETVATPFPSVLPLFHEENTDSNLVSTFAMDPSSPSKYREDEICITLHSPVLFSQIRSFLGMEMNEFREALGENAMWRQSISPGKSGTSFIFFGNFVLKSLKESEFKFLKNRFLRSYVSFCELNPDTMLPRFYALLSFSWLRLRSCKRYVLMQNVFFTRYYIHRIYDVKGSTVGRSTKTETAPRTSYGALLLKDNDLPAQLIICGPLQRAHVLAQFRSDVNFLQSLNIVDYSCLIGVRSRVFSRKEGPSKTIVLKERRGSSWQQTVTSEAIGVGTEQLHKMDNSCIHGCDGGLLSLPIYSAGDDTTAREDVYYLGIIDVLQEYTPAKRFENFAKGLWNDRRHISVVPPKEFAERLYKVLENITV
ncbi:putative phosphatidylinositol-4-phosphate 5-kinase-like [Trypanosoma cruzi]|uniref:Phosphatidylinositol-4-phosphate 5-kinase-like, putative n=2 Tax=Trypanosoma cruzi TaxID=5693 RepID=Q4DKY9_TRYCC|nr:phosphatidylinositol-4-phosphate 5-kinase-like, putative [Trypanosoma cruzi]EAN93198.1 phosphatidylinositol-4-phosphate 5-kinase-like, putative [Trypanosoma cruzi]PWV11172.1 putative phosphatidylinositol-4-phosphate 5-kinase-like [Trypanosoma cruzi]|eukprot:XP_815049.1 phosphatidylinositol-4-phosphate 5-kinase-like [Trypanosoma cruzi strain CL Brener]